MATMRLSGKEYAVTPQAEAFLKSYLSRVKRYVSVNGISEEYAQDIEDRLAEKLSYVGAECQEGDAVRIVNELGEPEDVFADAPKTKRSWIGEIAWAVKQNMKSPLYRDGSKGIIFGVCAGLGDKFEIDPIFVRLFFVFLFFFYGTGVLAYLVLALLMKDKSAFEQTAAQNTGIGTKADASFAKISAATTAKGSEIIERTISMAGSIIGFFFFGFVAFFLFSTSLGFLAAFGISASGIVIDNQDVFGGANPAVAISAGIMGSTLFALSWIAAFRAFWKKVASGWLLAAAWLLVAISLAAWAYGTFKTVANFAERQKIESVTDTGISTGTVSLEFDDAESKVGRKFPELPKWTEIRLVKSDSGSLQIRSVTEISASDKQNAESQFSNIAPLSVSSSGSHVKITNATAKYVRKSPYAFAKRTIEISAPENVKLKFGSLPKYAVIEGIAENHLASYAYANDSCTGLDVKYDKDAAAFICDPASYSPKAVETAKARYLENNGYEILDGIGADGGRRRYQTRVTVKPQSDGTFEVTNAPDDEYGEHGTGWTTKTYRVDVDASGNFVKTEVPGKMPGK